jgi:NNP family nitrate/nitrite transporter-like MFS transporter
MPGRRWIATWDPDDADFWRDCGRSVARRNLIVSMLAEFLGFAIWQLWSVVAVYLPRAGFHLSVGELFWLVSLPALIGATLRFPYGFAVPVLGGRNWTVVSAGLLLIPTIMLATVVRHPEAPTWLLLVAAASAGFGGGNFASSMSNISFFYPDRDKGYALGLNAAGGNIGVAVVQCLVPAVIGLGVLGLGTTTTRDLSLQWAGLVWIPFIALAVICAHLFMDNLVVTRGGLKEYAVVVRTSHTWLMSILYIGTFGSFIGYSAALPLLIRTQFPHVNPLQYAFLGPLLGSLARPIGGRLADRIGGARVTAWTFAVMIAATLCVILVLGRSAAPGAFPFFLTTFVVLFITTGVGNGSTFRMIPEAFRATHAGDVGRRPGGDGAVADRGARRESAAALAVTSAMGAYGGFLVPQSYGVSISLTGGPRGALVGFMAYYLACLALTWWYRGRRARPDARGEPLLVRARAETPG